jgi:hypothetical protein
MRMGLALGLATAVTAVVNVAARANPCANSGAARRLGLALLACVAAAGSGTALAQMSDSVRVGGAVAHLLTLTVDDLQRMPVQRVELPAGKVPRPDGWLRSIDVVRPLQP